MDRITFTFGPPYDTDGYGWVELIVEASGQIAHGGHAIPIEEAGAIVSNLGRVSHAANAEPQMHCGWWPGYVGAQLDTVLMLDIRPTAQPDMLAVHAEAVDHFEPEKKVEVDFIVSRARLRQFQRDCGKVMRKEAAEAVLMGEGAATAGTFAESAAVAVTA